MNNITEKSQTRNASIASNASLSLTHIRLQHRSSFRAIYHHGNMPQRRRTKSKTCATHCGIVQQRWRQLLITNWIELNRCVCVYYSCSTRMHNIIIAIPFLLKIPLSQWFRGLGGQVFFVYCLWQLFICRVLCWLCVDGSTFYSLPPSPFLSTLCTERCVRIYHRHPYFDACTYWRKVHVKWAYVWHFNHLANNTIRSTRLRKQIHCTHTRSRARAHNSQ